MKAGRRSKNFLYEKYILKTFVLPHSSFDSIEH